MTSEALKQTAMDLSRNANAISRGIVAEVIAYLMTKAHDEDTREFLRGCFDCVVAADDWQ